MADSFFLPKDSKRARRDRADDDGDADEGEYSSRRPKVDSVVDVEGDEENDAPEEERRLRAAKRYLDDIREEVGASDGEEDEDEDAVQTRLISDALEASGKAFHSLADSLSAEDVDSARLTTGRHHLSLTAVAMPEDDSTRVYSAAKDGLVCAWDSETGKCVTAFRPTSARNGKGRKHTSQVLAVAATSDGRYVASAGQDKQVHLWDPKSGELVESLVGHKGPVCCLAFRKHSSQLFSGAADRMIKVWNVDSRSYIETLYGHQAALTGVDCLERERVVSTSADRSCRVWKVPEETQLVFHTQPSPLECVSLCNESSFVTGSQDGSLSLWTTAKKAPIHVTHAAHGSDHWICSVSACKRTDLVASGSSDGSVKIWAAGVKPGLTDDEEEGSIVKSNRLSALRSVPAAGFVNALAFSKDGTLLVAAIGQEHRMGRWERNVNAKNGLVFVPLKYTN